MKKLVLLILFCFSIFSYSMEKKIYKKYYKQRFGYSIDACVNKPNEDLEDREAQNGDGIILLDDEDASAGVSGGFFISGDDAADGMGASVKTLKKYYNNTIKEHSKGLGYHILKKDFCVISYFEDNEIYYEKVMLHDRSSSCVKVWFSYPKERAEEMKPVLERITKSLKVNLPSVYDN